MAYEHPGNGDSIRRYFDSIPDDIILTILNKIGDVESLFSSYFSCMRFAHLVFHVTGSISVHIPSVHIPSQILVDPFFPVWPPGKLDFLSRFNQVDSVSIRFSCVNSDAQMPFGHIYRWKCESAGFIILHVKQRLASSDHDDSRGNCTVLSQQELAPDEFSACFDIEIIPLSDSHLRLRYIKELLGVLPNLNRVSAEDFEKQGRVIVDEEAVANLRNGLPLADAIRRELEVGGAGGVEDGLKKKAVDGGAGTKKADVGDVTFRYKLWAVSEVKLPFSEFILRGVTLIYYRLVEAADHIDIFEKNEYSEVAVRIMEEGPTFEQFGELPRFRFVEI